MSWTLALTQAIQQILYWKGVLRWIEHGKLSTTVLKHRATKGQENFSASHFQLPLDQIKWKVTTAYEAYHQIKIQHNSWDKWIGQLIAAQAAVQNMTKKRLWQQLWQCEAIQKTAAQVKWALGQNQTHGGLLQVEVPDPQDPQNGLWLSPRKPWSMHASMKLKGGFPRQLSPHSFNSHQKKD